MGRSVPRLSPSQRFAIFTLKQQGKSGREIAELCAGGYNELPPFIVSQSRANEVAREVADERGELYDPDLAKRPPSEVTKTVVTRLLHIAVNESDRLDKAQRRGKLNASQLGALAGAMGKLQALVDRVELGEGPAPDAPGADAQAKGDEAAKKVGSAWIADAVDDDAEPPPTPAAPPAHAHAPVADVALGEHGGSFAREDRRPGASKPLLTVPDH